MASCVEPKADWALPKSVAFSLDAVLKAWVDWPLLISFLSGLWRNARARGRHRRSLLAATVSGSFFSVAGERNTPASESPGALIRNSALRSRGDRRRWPWGRNLQNATPRWSLRRYSFGWSHSLPRPPGRWRWRGQTARATRSWCL